HFTYRDFIQCGETQRNLGIANLPRRPETYNAINALCRDLLDPIIDYFGAIKLTYGFASPGLTKHIRGAIAPKLDQHVGCEVSSGGELICPRGGAACDFIIEDEDMRGVADWIMTNLPFDRLYYYGKSRSIHLSYSRTPAGAAFEMAPSPSGRIVPRPLRLLT
ncbi:MAG: peptidase m15a, partial [Betaproteobacteria bacterium]